MSRRRARPRSPKKKVEPNAQVVTRRGPVLTAELDEGGRIGCLAKGKAKKAVVGDRVQVQGDVTTELSEGLIVGVAPRRTELARLDLMRQRRQVLAANLDRVFVVCAVEPPLRPGLIDRYLVAAHAQGLGATIVLNKTDLIDDPAEVDAQLAPYPPLGVPVLRVSAAEAEGLEPLRAALRDTTGILVGHSGVGKTSLLNALLPHLDEAVKTLSDASGKGQHTTTTTTLYRLPDGGALIDSPGIRSFGLWGVEADALGAHFVELAEHAAACHFNDCRHVKEPRCAVKAAVDEGEIHPQRYASYLRIREALIEERRGP